MKHYFWGMIRTTLTFIALFGWAVVTEAQDTPTIQEQPSTSTDMPYLEPSEDVMGTEGLRSSFEPLSGEEVYFGDFTPSPDTLALPSLTTHGHIMPIAHYPYLWDSMYSWDLHEGLNVTLGMSVIAQFGKHARSGAGFGQDVAMMYAVPLSKKLSFAAGGYFNRMSWSHDSFYDAGITAMLGYRFDEHWEAYISGQKSITSSNYIPYPLYNMRALGDRLRATVRYNFNPSMSIEVSVGTERRPRQDNFYDPRQGMPPTPPQKGR